MMKREEAPCDGVGHEINDCTDERKVPIVPKVDVNGACAAKEQEHKVHTKADRYDERAYECVVGYRGGGSAQPMSNTWSSIP